MSTRPDTKSLLGKDPREVPMSCQRIFEVSSTVPSVWIGPHDAQKLSKDDREAYELAHRIMCHLAIQAPTKHASGHPGGPLSAFTFAYFLSKRRNPHRDQPLRMSAGHLSVLAYGLQWLFGREGDDKRLQSPQAIIDTFRTTDGLPGHAEAGIGDIPFGAGPLGKGVSNGLGAALGLRYRKLPGTTDVLMADGDSQEGQVMEAFRLASHLRLDHLAIHGDFNDIQLSDMPSKTVAADFAKIAEAAGWQVIEVQNGNDPGQVLAALEASDSFLGKGRPIFLCYYTTMGHGVPVMEKGSNSGKENYHGTPLSKEAAEAALKDLPPLEELIEKYEPYRLREKKRYTSQTPTVTDASLPWRMEELRRKGYERSITLDKGASRKDFGATHVKNLMRVDPRIVVLHADLAGSGGFDSVAEEFPDRVWNVGVAEANMVMMAAGMRQVGLLPVTYTFAAFGTNEARANARLIDINNAHTRCSVLHVCTHAGVNVGEDGETHQEQNYLNLPFRRTQVWSPADSNQAGAMAEKAMEVIAEGYESVYVFMPRISHEQLKGKDGSPLFGKDYVFEGRVDLVRGSGDLSDKITILTTGITVFPAVAAADALTKDAKVQVRVLHFPCIHTIDSAAVMQAALETSHLITLEDHNEYGGLGTVVSDIIADFQLPCSLRRMGLSSYYPSGDAKTLLFIAGLDEASVKDAVLDELHTEVAGGEDVFVTMVHSLSHHSHHSEHAEKAHPFITRLREEQGYLERLREAWKKRTCDPRKFPSNTDLRGKL